MAELLAHSTLVKQEGFHYLGLVAKQSVAEPTMTSLNVHADMVARISFCLRQ